MKGHNALTRRQIVRTGVAATATVIAPSFVQVSAAATDSGEVELQTVATVPADTSLSITVFEDMNGDGTAERQQTIAVPDGTSTLVYDALQGEEAQGVEYWLEVNLGTSNDSVTPSLDSATLTLPATDQTTQPPSTPVPPPEKKDPGEIWESFLVFIAFIVACITGIAGLGSRSMAVGALAGYSAFAYLAITTGHVLLEQILYITLVIIIIGMAMKLWRAELGGSV